MKAAFDKHLKKVRWRCGFNLLFKQLAMVLSGAGLVVLLAVLVELCLALGVWAEGARPVKIDQGWLLWVFLPGVIVFTGLLWFFKRPNNMQVALLIDERLSLRERFSTALAVADWEDSFARAAVTEARQTAQKVKFEGYFPIRPCRRWLVTGGVWVLAGVVILFMPQLDLLGKMDERKQEQEQVRQLEAARSEVETATKAVSSAVKQLAHPELAEALGKFDSALAEGLKPDEVRRQAIRQLGDLSDKILQSQSENIEAARMTRQMLRRLRGSPSELTRDLNLALAQSNFGRAAQIMEAFQRQMDQSELSEEQRRALAEQLEKLAQQLKELSQQDQQLERELEKLNLDKKLAQMSPEELLKALEKMGLDQEKIEQLMRMAGASRLARSQISRLGEAMAGMAGGGMGGLSGDEMVELAEQLGEMEALQEEFYLTQATLDEIARSIAGLGEGWGDSGAYTDFMEGAISGFGPGTGGPGKGYGGRDSDDSGDTALQRTQTETKTGQGQMVASWMFDGPQVKGESRLLQWDQMVEEAQESVSEAISENEIPRKFETAIKNYFGALKKQTDKK